MSVQSVSIFQIDEHRHIFFTDSPTPRYSKVSTGISLKAVVTAAGIASTSEASQPE